MSPRPNAFPQRLVRSAGALVWRPVGAAVDVPVGAPLQPKDFEVLLVHRPRYRDWSWPKGKAELNEPLAQAAVREVEEESGVAVVLHAPMTTQRYRLGSGQTKEVHYWVGREIVDGAALHSRPPVTPASRKEIDLTQWCTPSKAKQMLNRRGDRRLLNELVARAASGELTTSKVILLRHAKAVSRSDWAGSEPDRPLTRLGGVQAIDLVPQLSAFGVDRIISSPWTRCLQTVSPFATLGRLQVEQQDILSEDGTESNPKASRRLVEGLLQGSFGSTLVCLHKPGLKHLLQPLQEETAVRHFPAIDSPKPGLRTAEIFVAHISHADAPQVTFLERHSTFTKVALA